MDSLTYIFLKRLPPVTLLPLKRYSKKQLHSRRKLLLLQCQQLHIQGMSPKRFYSFNKKTSPPAKLKNNMASEIKAMKEMMSLLSNELIKIKLNSSRNQGNHLRKLVAQNNYSQNLRGNFCLYSNINNENNGIVGMRLS